MVQQFMMEFWKRKSKILVTCPKGIPPWLAGEVRALGFPVLAEGEAVVETEGTLADTMPLNLHIRKASTAACGNSPGRRFSAKGGSTPTSA